MADGTQALMQLAQANESGEAIGQISTSSGEVFITRTDGSEVKGGEGAEIFQGDMVRTGDGGDVSMVFADDTTFSLGGDAEMTIDEMVYDPGSESGSAAFSVAKGVFGFVSGQLAKVDPDAMVIDTPVATIGIRGSSGTGEAGPEGAENTFVLVPDPDGTIGEIIIQTETGSVVMNVPYQVSSVLSTFISPTAPVVLPASVVRQVFGNTVDALAEARSAAGVDDTPPSDTTLESTATAEEAAAALAEADAAPGEGEVGDAIAAEGESLGAEAEAALEQTAEEIEAAAAAEAEAAAEAAALEAAAEAPVDEAAVEAAAAAEEAFQESLDAGGSLVDAFRAAATASEEKGAEVRDRVERELVEQERELDQELGAAAPDPDDALDDLLNQAADAQEDGGSSGDDQAGEPSEDEQAAVDAGLFEDILDLTLIQARDQLASGFSRVLTEDELAEIKAAEAEAEAEAEAAAEAAAVAAAAAAAAVAAAAEAARIAKEKQAEADAEAARLDALAKGPTTGVDTLTGGAGDDIFVFNGGKATPGDTVDGAGGDDTIKVSGAEDFTQVTITNVENMDISGADTNVKLTKAQVEAFGDGKIVFEAGLEQSVSVVVDGNFNFGADGAAIQAKFANYNPASHTMIIVADDDGRIITGDNNANTIFGGAGADTINGGLGDDTIDGGAGRDTIQGGGGDDTINGGAGADKIIMGGGDDTITLGSLNDADADKLKFQSFTSLGTNTVTDFNGVDSPRGAADQFVFDAGLMSELTKAEDSSVSITTIGDNEWSENDNNTSSDAVNDLTTGQNGKAVFEFSGSAHEIGAIGGTNSAADVIAAFLGTFGAGQGNAIETTAGAKHIFIAYGNGEAYVFHFVDNGGGGAVEDTELTLLATLNNVAEGSLGHENFAFSGDPLIFDLDNDGNTIIGEGAGAQFDVDGDGTLEKTGWFDSGDGMLVIDENNNGKIDGMQEVVSSFLTYGDGKAAGKSSLDALAAFDDNGDGQITEADAIYSVLKLWNDKNSDGVTDEGELLSLADYGITRIGLGGTDAEQEVNGGTIHRTAEAEKENGEKITVSEVSFDPGAEVPEPDAPPSMV